MLKEKSNELVEKELTTSLMKEFGKKEDGVESLIDSIEEKWKDSEEEKIDSDEDEKHFNEDEKDSSEDKWKL